MEVTHETKKNDVSGLHFCIFYFFLSQWEFSPLSTGLTVVIAHTL